MRCEQRGTSSRRPCAARTPTSIGTTSRSSPKSPTLGSQRYKPRMPKRSPKMHRVRAARGASRIRPWSGRSRRIRRLPTTTAPRFTIDGATFELGFAHRWSLRISTRRVADFDGGVVEVTTDKGKTWTDISEYGTVDYNTTLDEGRDDNVLEGRRAYGNKSKGYPDQWVASRIKVDLKAHPEVVQIRFRHASGTGSRGLQAGRSTRSISAGSRTRRSGRSSVSS